MKKIHEIVNNTPLISETRKGFYSHMLDVRKSAIIDKALMHLISLGIGQADQNKEYILDDRYFDIESVALEKDIVGNSEHSKDKEYTKQQDTDRESEETFWNRRISANSRETKGRTSR